MRRRLWLCTALVPLAGCTAAPPISPPSPPPVKPAAVTSLVAFDSCAQLAEEMRAAATRARTMRTDLTENRPLARAADAAPVPAATAFSGTNTHEAGADEPDIVKTDGRRIVVVDQGVLRVIDPVTRTQTGRLSLGGNASQLLLAGDRALVLVTGSPRYDTRRLLPPSSGRAEVLLVDLAGSPRVLSRYRGDGRVVDARQTGSVARVVVSTTPSFTQPLNAMTADAWLPHWEITTGTSTATGKVGCPDVVRPRSYSGTAMLTVLTFDLTAPALTDGDPVSVVSDGDIVYGTPTSLYLANDQSWRRGNDTEIFKFALPAAGKPVLTASGTVPGVLLNQYSLSEWDQHLRVATTDGMAGGSGASAVRVLAERDGKLISVGIVGGLGRGERIYAVRFLGPRAYVVTFRQTDPLYSLDLSDPARPRVTGELKINGYSAHLQPVGDDRLIGIGQDASAQGVRQGLQVSLFDVADPAAPRRLAQEVVPGAQSEAEFDPHALLWWPATRLLVVPVAGSGALALTVDGSGLSPVAKIGGTDVRRALVIGDELWTLTGSGLAAADLSTLDQVGRVSFS